MQVRKHDKRSRPLRVYHYVFELDHLHYGLWEPDDPLTLTGLKAAQQRYEDYLVERLPVGTRTLLDVGCGTGMMSLRFDEMGLEVEGLSPHPHERDLYRERLAAPFHLVPFQDFVTEARFDCVLMSESAQYISPESLLAKAAICLKRGGWLMICDYFVRDHATGIMAESGHKLTAFKAEATRQGFELKAHEELTNRVLPTLDLAAEWADRVALAADILSEDFRDKHPWITKLIAYRARQKITRLKEERRLLDSEEFIRNKQYLFLLYRLGEAE